MEMSVQSTSHIWQYTDLDASTTSICCVDKKQINDVYFFNSKIKDIESETKCFINLHGLENKNPIVWIRIKSKSIDSRRFALLLINSYTNNSCKEIVLPKLQSNEIAKTKKPLTRSSTEYSIASIASIASNANSSYSSSSAPFSSILAPFKEEPKCAQLNTHEPQFAMYERKRFIQKDDRTRDTKKRYNLDFLLARSMVDESKKLPKNWKELNLMYPNICFVGTVLSYFNANKYYDHWIKLQNENTELHNPVRTISSIQYLNLNQDNRKYIIDSNRDDNNNYNKYKESVNYNFNKKKNTNVVSNVTSSGNGNGVRFAYQSQKQSFTTPGQYKNQLQSKNVKFCTT